MIDMHTHLLNNVDNGVKDYNEAGKILLEAMNQGITQIILTPHMNTYVGPTKKDIIDKFNRMKNVFEKKDIELYLGAEIEYSRDVLDKIVEGKLLTMNNTKFILMDFTSSSDYDIIDVIRDYKRLDIKIIIAHCESYNLSAKEISAIKTIGGYIQIDAETILNPKYKKWLKNLYKDRLIDFVASNIHSPNVKYVMKQAFNEVVCNTNKEYAEKIFMRNQKNLLL